MRQGHLGRRQIANDAFTSFAIVEDGEGAMRFLVPDAEGNPIEAPLPKPAKESSSAFEATLRMASQPLLTCWKSWEVGQGNEDSAKLTIGFASNVRANDQITYQFIETRIVLQSLEQLRESGCHFGVFHYGDGSLTPLFMGDESGYRRTISKLQSMSVGE